jgi:hypothetical protein
MITADHLAHLRESSLSDQTIKLAQLRSVTDPAEIANLLTHKGTSHAKKFKGALVFPFFEPGGSEPFAARVRPNFPQLNKDGSIGKYLSAHDAGILVYFPPACRLHGRYQDATLRLHWVEGEKKALLLSQLGYATVGLTGVNCAHDKPARDRGDGYHLHPMIKQHVAIRGRAHLICFDSDARTNNKVYKAARVLAGMLVADGAASVRFVAPPPPAQAAP